MFYYESTKKYLKRVLKGKKAITTALVVSFLISGGFSGEIEARDLRTRNEIQVSSKQGPEMSLSEKGTDVINILNPKNGISHNKYDSFNVGEGNSVIFNNSKKDGSSVLGGKVKANINLKDSANVILNEIEGNSVSHLDGSLEIFGKKADLVIANENGISVNGANFINTGATTLSTGKVFVNKDRFSLETFKGNGKVVINKKGLKTDGDYLNLISNTMKINGNINSEMNMNTNINAIVGENKVIFNNNESTIEKNNKSFSKSREVAISGNYLGAMYGKNINIISTKEGVGVKYDGLISSTDDILIDANGKIATKNIKAKNIVATSNKEILNKGSMEAKENIVLNAPVVRNVSTLEGKVQIKDNNVDKTLIDRDRGVIYYDYHLNLQNLEEIKNTLNLKKATIIANNNIIINNDLENASFENIGGDLHAGNILNVKGNFKTSDPTKDIKIEDILKRIKVSLNWEHRSLVDNAYFNGKTTLENGSLLDALKIMTGEKTKEYYDSLKQIKDPILNKLLSSYLGADWKVQDNIKSEENWNKEASLKFYSGDSSSISAKNIKLEGKNISFGNKKEDISEELLIDGEVIKTKKAEFNTKKNIKVNAENILVNAENFNNNNTDILAKENLFVASKKGINIIGSALKGKDVLLTAEKNINISSEVGYDKNGNKIIAKKSLVEGEKTTGIKGKEINFLGTDVNTKNNGALNIKANSLSAKDLKTISTFYDTKMIEGERRKGRILKEHEYTKEMKATVDSEASTIKANTVVIDTDKDIEIIGSLISGNSKDSNIYIESKGKVDIKNTNNLNYTDYISDARGMDKKGKYRIVNINKNNKKEMDVIKSVLESQGNVYIKSKNLNFAASEINAKKNIELKATENLNILATLNKTKEEAFASDWGSGSAHRKHLTSEKEGVVSSVIKAGNKLKLTADKKLNNVSSEIEGASVNMVGKESLVNSALASKEKISETKVGIGVRVGASVGFAGMGVTGSVDTINNTVKTSVSGVDGLLEADNKFKKVYLKGNIGSDLKISTNSSDTNIYKNNVIKTTKGNIDMASEGVVDIGNTNLTSGKDINISGAEVTTSTKENTKEEVSHNAKFGIDGKIKFSNEVVTKINNMVNDAIALKELATVEQIPDFTQAVIEVGKNTKEFIENISEIPKKDIVGINSDESINISYDNIIKKEVETTFSKLDSKGKVNIIAKTGDVSLKNTNIKAEEVNLNAKENINLLAGEKKVHEENNGFNIGVHVIEDVGVNIVDGATTKIGVGASADYHGSTNINNKSLNTDIKATTIKKDAKEVKVDDKTSSHYKDGRGLGVDVEAKIGVSSNHILTADGKVGGNMKYVFDDGKSKETPDGKKESFNVKGGVNASASVETSGENPDFSMGTEAFEVQKNDKVIVQLDPLSDLVTKAKVDKIVKKIKEKKGEE